MGSGYSIDNNQTIRAGSVSGAWQAVPGQGFHSVCFDEAAGLQVVKNPFPVRVR